MEAYAGESVSPDLLQQQVACLEERNCDLRTQLERTQRELRVTHELTAVMHASLDTGEIQDKILRLVTEELGFERATLARFDPHNGVLTGWIARTDGNESTPSRSCIPQTVQLKVVKQGRRAARSPLARAVIAGTPVALRSGEAPTGDGQIDNWLGTCQHAILPLVMRGRLLGVLIVDNPQSSRPVSEGDFSLLVNIASQSALVLGSLQLCIDRAQRLAVEEERSRIAMEIHDNVSQHLYGIAYALDAGIKLLPQEPQLVKNKLMYLLPQVQETSAAIRQTIFDLWPDEFDADRLDEELRNYLRETGQELELATEIDDHFGTLPISTRKQIFLIAEEGLANIIKHACASQASITLTWSPVEIVLAMRDNGRGFDQPGDGGSERRTRFGLTTMQERARALGGTLAVSSKPNHGTSITARIPLGIT